MTENKTTKFCDRCKCEVFRFETIFTLEMHRVALYTEEM